MRSLLVGATVLSIAATATAQPATIIDMHFHALTADWNGPPGGYICAPFDKWAVRDSAKPITAFLHDFTGDPKCKQRFKSPQTDAELRDQSLAVLKRRNILAVTSGPADGWRISRARAGPHYSGDNVRLRQFTDDYPTAAASCGRTSPGPRRTGFPIFWNRS